MYSRPKPGETEEDLLRLQKEFEKNKAQNKIIPAATVVSDKTKENIQHEKESESTEVIDIQEQLANTFEAIPSNIKLKGIVENKSENIQCVFKFNKTSGFPKAKRRNVTTDTGKGSLFSQQMKKTKKEEVSMEMDSIPIIESNITIKEHCEPSSSGISTSNHKPESLPNQSYILTGEDSQQIHQENVHRLKNMTVQEIIEEREKLLSMMDPAIIQFLRSRRKKEHIATRNPPISEQNKAAESVKIEEIDTTFEILTQPKADKWLNFDIVETNKLAWMKNIDIPKIKSEKFEARFDFEGWILPYSQSEITEKNRALYHHGDEPGRPGYTLQELFQLSRSSIIQQKVLALNTIANILSLNSTGVYDEIIDVPIEQIFFVIRFCLDDNTPSILNASIRAMRNLIYSQVDETCLDSLLGFGLGLIQPVLAIDNEMEDDNTVNDQQLAEKDIVKCLARTDILTRIRYIINTVQPPLESLVYCMDILIRLSRDSEFILQKIMDCEGLIDNIVKHFIPKVFGKGTSSSPYGLPLLQAIKLLRVLSSRSKNIATKFITKYRIFDSIILYLSNDTFSLNVNGLKLQTECMHFWNLLVYYGLTLDYFSILQPTLLNLLDYHYKNTNLEMTTTYIRLGHVSALLILLSNVARQNYPLIAPFLTLFDLCLCKWSAQFYNLKEYMCGKLQLIASLAHCMTAIIQYMKIENVDNRFIQVINSEGFKVVTSNIKSGSMLLNNYETHKSSSNLKTLDVAAWHTMDHVVPLIQTNSCIPFLYSMSLYVNTTNNKKVKTTFLNHPNIQNYLISLQKLEKYYLTSHWFARPEAMFLMDVLKSSVVIKNELDTSIFYDLAVKCLCVFNSEQKNDIRFILANIIFCSKFYPSEVLMKHLDISLRNVSLEISLNNLNEILKVYTQILGLQQGSPDFSRSCCLNISVGNVIPMDWIYTPILVLYSNQQQNKKEQDEQEQVFVISNCLRWILIYETYFPFLASRINPTDKFCRLACVFLGSDNLFLIPEIHDLLELCLKNVLKYERELNFDKEIQGLSNFQDFYTQLLEQYQGVSYGDVLFGNIIVVPLAQKHNLQFRKTLWSEYMGVVQVFNMTPEQYNGNIDLLLEPQEDDMSLLKCYRRAIVSNMVRKHTILFKIANHHVESFIKRKRTE
ncbi:RNA polymerase II-associated protein 1 [Diorhabda sublineata]|uniref:RNA polymerase II-associated protein 1 n=1 Tax=Diorhabda sublineata TaxID=1163346 RepID=UPI0024E08DAC|nr:RNA polymerase II-associated protein 1 [Diorhabda sublineata]